MKRWIFPAAMLLLLTLPLWSQTAAADSSDGILQTFWHMISSPEGFREMIEWGGYFVLFAIIFAETGLLIGFFLPGDHIYFNSCFLFYLFNKFCCI